MPRARLHKLVEDAAHAREAQRHCCEHALTHASQEVRVSEPEQRRSRTSDQAGSSCPTHDAAGSGEGLAPTPLLHAEANALAVACESEHQLPDAAQQRLEVVRVQRRVQLRVLLERAQTRLASAKRLQRRLDEVGRKESPLVVAVRHGVQQYRHAERAGLGGARGTRGGSESCGRGALRCPGRRCGAERGDELAAAAAPQPQCAGRRGTRLLRAAHRARRSLCEPPHHGH